MNIKLIEEIEEASYLIGGNEELLHQIKHHAHIHPDEYNYVRAALSNWKAIAETCREQEAKLVRLREFAEREFHIRRPTISEQLR